MVKKGKKHNTKKRVSKGFTDNGSDVRIIKFSARDEL